VGVRVLGRGVWEGAVAGGIGGVVGGVPSTGWALVTGGRVLAAAEAAGAVMLPGEVRSGRLVLAALPVHFGISVGWGVVLSFVLPRRGTALWGAVAGVVIAGVSLRLPGRRVTRVRELPFWPQVADHVAFGAVVGGVLADLRSSQAALRRLR
jgi:hypothetical protein